MTMEKLNKLLQEGKIEIVEEEMSDVCKQAVELIKYWLVKWKKLNPEDYIIRVLREDPVRQEYHYLVDLVDTSQYFGAIYHMTYNRNTRAWLVSTCTNAKYKLIADTAEGDKQNERHRKNARQSLQNNR